MAAITTAAIGLAASGYQVYSSEKKKKQAQNELNNYERQELTNAFENVKISTMGSDLLKEENARNTANLVDATRIAGDRTIIGGIPRIVASSNEVSREAAKMLDDQVKQKEYAIAGDKTRIQGITENRDISNISALSSQVDAANQDKWNGINGAISSIYSLGNAIGKPKNTENLPVESPINNISGPKIENNKVNFSSLIPNTPYSNYSKNPYILEENTDLINKYNRSTKNQIF